MVIVRGTKKMLTRVGGVTLNPEVRSTTELGDWYADLLFTRHARLVLLVSERSLLSVLLPARDLSHFADRFREAAAEVFAGLDASPSAAEAEVMQMKSVEFGPTASRTVLGCMNDLAFQARTILEDQPELGLKAVALKLARVPFSSIGNRFPGDLAVVLLSASEQLGSVQ